MDSFLPLRFFSSTSPPYAACASLLEKDLIQSNLIGQNGHNNKPIGDELSDTNERSEQPLKTIRFIDSS
jgi:hypothetical protein